MSDAVTWDDARVKFALEAVAEAARMAREIQRRRAGLTLSKEDQSPVTVADFSVQALIARRLSAAFPGEPLVAEEDSGLLESEPHILEAVVGWVSASAPDMGADNLASWIDRGGAAAASRFWTLDPIDGTKGFLRGEQYAVALAYLEEGEVRLGVLGCPNLTPSGVPDMGGDGSVIAAVRGAGCRSRALRGGPFETLQVSPQTDIQAARVLRSVEAGHTNVGQFNELIERLGVRAPAVCLDSQAKYGALAAGRGELMLRLVSPARPGYREKIWDHAAGSIVVEEAGGRVTDLRGKPLNFQLGRRLEENVGVAASNGRLHDVVLDALNALHAEQ